jgi:hypothetical protein
MRKGVHIIHLFINLINDAHNEYAKLSVSREAD